MAFWFITRLHNEAQTSVGSSRTDESFLQVLDQCIGHSIHHDLRHVAGWMSVL